MFKTLVAPLNWPALIGFRFPMLELLRPVIEPFGFFTLSTPLCLEPEYAPPLSMLAKSKRPAEPRPSYSSLKTLIGWELV